MGAGRLYPGQILAATQNLIVVTFNFRLGPLGKAKAKRNCTFAAKVCLFVAKFQPPAKNVSAAKIARLVCLRLARRMDS